MCVWHIHMCLYLWNVCEWCMYVYVCVCGGVYVCEREVCVPVGSTVCTVSGVCVCWGVFVYLRALPIYIHKVM